MRNVIFALFIMYSQIGWSIEIKLICNIDVSTSYSNGHEEKERLSELFIITDDSNYKSIISSSTNFVSVSNQTMPEISDVKDFSDSNRWYIANTQTNPQGSTMTTTIKIDRNVGSIFYSSIFSKGQSYARTIGSGDCEKVNTSKKKF